MIAWPLEQVQVARQARHRAPTASTGSRRVRQVLAAATGADERSPGVGEERGEERWVTGWSTEAPLSQHSRRLPTSGQARRGPESRPQVRACHRSHFPGTPRCREHTVGAAPTAPEGEPPRPGRVTLTRAARGGRLGNAGWNDVTASSHRRRAKPQTHTGPRAQPWNDNK